MPWDIEKPYDSGDRPEISCRGEAGKLYFGSSKYLKRPEHVGRSVEFAIGNERECPRIVGFVERVPSGIAIGRWPAVRRSDTEMTIEQDNAAPVRLETFPSTDDSETPEFLITAPYAIVRINCFGKHGTAEFRIRFPGARDAAEVGSLAFDGLLQSYGPSSIVRDNTHRKTIAAIAEVMDDTPGKATNEAIARVYGCNVTHIESTMRQIMESLRLPDKRGQRPAIIYRSVGQHPDVLKWREEFFGDRG